MKRTYISDCEYARLTDFLSERINDVTLCGLKRLIKAGEVRINGMKVRNNIALKKNDTVDIFIPAGFVVPVKDAQVIYFDRNIAVVDKPAGMDTENNLASIIKQSFPEAKPVNRLDRNTSGLVIFALGDRAEKILRRAIKERKVEKYYRATVEGIMEKPAADLKAYLVKDSEKSFVRIYDSPVTGAKEIITRYKVISSGNNTSELDVMLITGRTHQIRAHLSHIGHPVVGDGKYGKGGGMQKLRAYRIVLGGLTGELSYLNGKDISTF